ncbi:MAG: response regulator [Acidobacteriaceae bacterium]|nr:response regulator [Acidobacteriaceae bacterium]MBV9225115.1 response regulator [Acidobacteriaceae bacterium]MBV9308814.1 response regulator [Acidobacteriaceae bacterium]MBV9938539.1 response regulator [Acidobacteriaceae bacterium]
MARERFLMLIEDSPEDEELTVRAIRRSHVTAEIFVARDGEEAMNFLFAEGEQEGRDLSEMPDLVLLDLKLPMVGGHRILERMRATPHTRRLPVVVLTSSNEDGDIERAYDLGANSYIRKPVNSEEFLSSVSQLGLYWLTLNQPVPRR